MKLLQYLLILPLVLLQLQLISCTQKKYQDAASFDKLSLDSPNVTHSSDIGDCKLFIEFDDVNKLKDTIDSSSLFEWEISDDIKVKFNTNNGVPVKVTKTICFYPTIWSSEKDELIQFVYLYDLGYRESEELLVENGVITYPERFTLSDKDYFQNVTSSQVSSSIKRLPASYQSKAMSGSYELSSWTSEEPMWLKLVSQYKKGMFKERGDTFSIDPKEIYIDITFRDNEGKEINKVFTDRIIIGN